MQKKFVPSHKLQDHAYQQQNPFRLKEDNLCTVKLSESNEPYKFVSHRARMSEEFDARKDSHSTKLEQRPQILIKLGFRELYDLKSYLV